MYTFQGEGNIMDNVQDLIDHEIVENFDLLQVLKDGAPDVYKFIYDQILAELVRSGEIEFPPQ
jgi:hypothetical protein